jgi:manganese-dependent ADP-ribose/CDP-alcohol diphosphatase
MKIKFLFRLLVLELLCSPPNLWAQAPSLSIGLITDCQYCNDPGEGIRKYSLSRHKLSECVHHFNALPLDYVIHLGDFIDRDFASFAVVSPIYDSLEMPAYHVLGNHDFSVPDDMKDQVPNLLKMPSRYYHFDLQGWRFIILDGNDLSFHAYPANSELHRVSSEYYTATGTDSPKWNGAVGSVQMQWLEERLTEATDLKLKVIIYCHFPVFPENIHNLWNGSKVLKLITGYKVVKAYINGHNHAGNYGISGGIHFLTLQGMVDTPENSYAILSLFSDHLEVEGFGREESRSLKF